MRLSELLAIFSFCLLGTGLPAQAPGDPSQLTLERIYASGEFRQQGAPALRWIADGAAYVIRETDAEGRHELVAYTAAARERTAFLTAAQLTPQGADQPLAIAGFSLSADESQVLIFTNTRRLWRSHTRGDYWTYDRDSGRLRQLGRRFPAGTLMFAKFSADNRSVAYVQDFNLYREDPATGEITALTTDGTGDIINGTFDWAYEEEWGTRDGFRWSPDGRHLAYWQLDASTVGTFHLINNTDSVYSRIVPVQYPKVGEDPSAARAGVVDAATGVTRWIDLPGDPVQHYLPALQWVDADRLLLQQFNRKQNHLRVWEYTLSTHRHRLVYEERDERWVDLQYPDPAASHWGENDLVLVDNGRAFLRLREDGWRNLRKVYLATGRDVLLSPGDYDVAAYAGRGQRLVYYLASPDNATQRYLYATDVTGERAARRLTPPEFPGMNTYDVAPNGRYAVHTHHGALSPPRVTLISLPDHAAIATLADNAAFRDQLAALELPSVAFRSVTTADGITTDARLIRPAGFDSTRAYPVIFNVYGEPWGQVATDAFIGLWNIYLAQQGYVVVAIDNRGTPALRGTEWRKSIYRNIGRVNIRDLAGAADVLLDLPYLDRERAGVWGWSGGGTSTLNLLFQHPGLFRAGVAVASVANQLTYDNIYQERYMGLPRENREDFVAGSPITHAAGLEDELLLIHGTADDNVHYQNHEMLVNELIKHHKQFAMMAYPNRSHGMGEGEGTKLHLYTLIAEFFGEHLR